MSYDEFGAPEPPRTGMSTGTKVLLFAGGGCAVVVLLCCGALGFSGMWFGRMIEGAASEDPEVVAEVTGELADIRIPEELQPGGSFRLEIPFTEQKTIFVMYEHEDDDAFLVLMHFGPLQIDAEDVADAIEQQVAQQRAANPDLEMRIDEDFVVEETERREFVIRGQLATFIFSRGRDEESGESSIQVAGSFEGKIGPVMLLLFAREDAISEEEIVEMIESIE